MRSALVSLIFWIGLNHGNRTVSIAGLKQEAGSHSADRPGFLWSPAPWFTGGRNSPPASSPWSPFPGVGTSLVFLCHLSSCYKVLDQVGMGSTLWHTFRFNCLLEDSFQVVCWFCLEAVRAFAMKSNTVLGLLVYNIWSFFVSWKFS